jgi:tRNA (cytidine/uridine-2'-O-)-methyltransferase
MFNIVLYQPEIPPNTGNIMRLCSNTGCTLHLVGPTTFDLSEKNLRRAHLDYRDLAVVREHAGWEAFLETCTPKRLLAFSTKGRERHTAWRYAEGDYLLFGPESRGLPEELLQPGRVDAVLRLPMVAGSRSLNLSNAVAVALFEAWRQLDFSGATDGS